MASVVDLAVISNEPTPYRVHFLRRLGRELPAVTLHSLFTHSADEPSAPWRIAMPEEIQPVTFGDLALRPGRPLRGTGPLFRAIRAYLVDQQVRMIVLHGYNDLCRARLIRWAARHDVPLWVAGDFNIHGESQRPAWKRWLKRGYLRWQARRVTGFMPMGRAGRALIEHHAGREVRMVTVPYEPDYTALADVDGAAVAAFRAAHGMTGDHRHLLYVGRLVEPKRVDVLIDAFAVMSDDRPDWRLVVAGDGPLRAALESRVPAAIRQRVLWLGFLQFDELRCCYHGSDVLVLPSTFEPWAVVINEALACGLAVVTTSVVGAGVELVREGVNGCLIPPNDPAALVAAMRRVTDPPTLASMKRASGEVLADWRREADPVAGVRQALAMSLAAVAPAAPA